MPITQIPSNQVITRQPKIFVYNNSSPSMGVYYTALDTTGRGKVSKITLTNDISTNDKLYIKVTIDGIINSFSSPTVNYSVGLNHLSTGGTFGSSYSIDYFCDIYFLNSCKVEFMYNSSGSAPTFQGTIMYSTE